MSTSDSDDDEPLPLLQRLAARSKLKADAVVAEPAEVVPRARSKRKAAMAKEHSGPKPKAAKVKAKAKGKGKGQAKGKPPAARPRTSKKAVSHLPALRVDTTALPSDDVDWALEKATRIRGHAAENREEVEDHTRRVKYGDVGRLWSASMVFAQGDGGSAVCVSPTGRIVTCAHCLGDEPAIGAQRWARRCLVKSLFPWAADQRAVFTSV